MPRPPAGELRHSIVIESLEQARDDQGGMLTSWALFSSLRARVANLSGNEQNAVAGGGATGEARTEFTTRFVPGIDTTMRVVFAGNHYNIKHVNDFNEEHRYLIITCDTGLSDG